MEGTAPRRLGRFCFLDCQLLSVFIIPHVMVEKLKWHHHLSQIASVYSFLSSVENKVHSYLRGKSLLPLQMGHQSFHSTLLLMNGDNYKWWEGCFHCLKHKLLYYMEESVLLGTKPLVDSIRHFIRDPSGVFSVCHLCECRIVQWRHDSRLLLLLNWFLHIIKRTLHVSSKIWILCSRGTINVCKI